jgi:hypothetical protein
MPHVAIVLHRQDSLDRRSYWLRAVAECWRAAGIHVSVVRDPRAPIDADLAVLHVDLTVVPPEYLACVQSAAASVNGRVSDISKRAVSTHLVHHGDRYEGPVIVKTNWNDRGTREIHAARRGLISSLRPQDVARNCRTYVREAGRRVRRWRRYGSHKAFLSYPVFDSMAAVPDAVWEDEDFVVERFLPERRDGQYCIRTWLFFGDRERHAMLDEVPEKLRQIRRELKFDFGKFDYTIVDGQPVLFDANRTPSIGDFPRDRYLPIAQTLAEGIGIFLRPPQAIEPIPGAERADRTA